MLANYSSEERSLAELLQHISEALKVRGWHYIIVHYIIVRIEQCV